MVRFGGNNIRAVRSQPWPSTGTRYTLLVAEPLADALAGDVLKQYAISTAPVFLALPERTEQEGACAKDFSACRVCACGCVRVRSVRVHFLCVVSCLRICAYVHVGVFVFGLCR